MRDDLEWYNDIDVSLHLSTVLIAYPLSVHSATSFDLPTETTSVLMQLSSLAGLANFYFSLLFPFLSIVCTLSSQAKSFQIFLYAVFPQFTWSTLLPFSSNFKFHNPTYLGVDVSTDNIQHYCTRLCISVSSNFTTTPTLSWITSVDTLSTSRIPHIIPITVLHPTQPYLICNKRFPRFTTVQQNGLKQHW